MKNILLSILLGLPLLGLNAAKAAVDWHDYDPKDLHISLFSNGGELKCKSLSARKMSSIYANSNRQKKQ